ncbi:hypothetical protein BBF93_00215 [Hyphomonas sp. CACIAM 19H1]|uniref:ATP-binding protein n=1 Tax=Hyphomonas sp. CACIAM 19H1 TaxID=1873716 RepID=UPI000DED8A45|nr:ATP-binding protein [Hyphomonas sp. CACIAM 19H1]AXE62806.1 hypothetical protein BBF93_00215 [Hyphomonas sp. CACIAM 19H1]
MNDPSIRYQDIRPYAGSQNTGFEELVSQLAYLETRPADSRFFRKGAGADGGLECFVRLSSGKEKGWQAKYVFGWDASLQAQLNTSIKRALEKHPDLDHYIVCLPFDPPDGRKAGQKSALQKAKEWLEGWEQNSEVIARAMRIEFWFAADLTRLLTASVEQAGRIHYWFGQHMLSPDWFQQQFDQARASLGNRYTPETHIDLPERRCLMAMAREGQIGRDFRQAKLRFTEYAQKLERECRKLDPASAALIGLRAALVTTEQQFSTAPVGPDEAYAIESLRGQLLAVSTGISDVMQSMQDAPGEERTRGDLEETLRALFRVQRDIYDMVRSFDDRRWKFVDTKALLVHGPAGIGKSHLLADIVDALTQHDNPSLLLIGGQLQEGDLWRQILTNLDVPASIPVETFLCALDAAAQTKRMRALLCVDAINENNGVSFWPKRLAAFLKKAARFRHIAIILTCRSTYRDSIIPHDIPDGELAELELEGFAADGGAAANAYLDIRGIVRPGAPNLAPEVNNPLILKTLCDNLEKRGEKVFPKGTSGLTRIFDLYRKAAIEKVNSRLGLDPRRKIVETALEAFVDELFETQVDRLPYVRAASLFDEHHDSSGRLQVSLLNELISEGVLTAAPSGDSETGDQDEVHFTFERFGDLAIAARVLDLEAASNGLARAIMPGGAIHKLLSGPQREHRAGLIEALAIMLPERAQVEVLDILAEEEINYVVASGFITSLTMRAPGAFTPRTLELAKSYSSGDELWDWLVAISTEPENSFNAFHLHDQLIDLPMPERDRKWSLYLARAGEGESNALHTLIDWAISNGHRSMEEDRAELAGITLTWFLATSHRAVRDRATKALSALIAPRLNVGVRLLKRFKTINDPYIAERLHAALYGAALQRLDVAGLARLCEEVYVHVFSSGAPPLNALLRDHACGLLLLGDALGILPDRIKPEDFTPPYSSPWPLEPLPASTLETYVQRYSADYTGPDDIVRSTSGDGDFGHYIIDPWTYRFSQEPIGAAHLPDMQECYQTWLGRFELQANDKARRAYEDLLEIAKRLEGSPAHEDKENDAAFDAAEGEFKSTVDPDCWAEYVTHARNFLRHWLFGEREPPRTAVRFHSPTARDWVCKRAHDLGWTPDLFGSFDRDIGGDRHSHRVERIGKKYQWIAFQELAARMSDNLSYIDRADDNWSDVPAVYPGARETRLRNIDPSMLRPSTFYQAWGQWPQTWWTPVNIDMDHISPEDRLIWLDADVDVLNHSGLIEVTDPRGRKWLVLNTFKRWSQYQPRDGSQSLERQVHYNVQCTVSKKADLSKALRVIEKARHTEDFCEFEYDGRAYIGEHPWAPYNLALGDWVRPTKWNGLTHPLRPTCGQYLQETGGYDYSVDETISIALPPRWLIEALNLRLSGGASLDFVNSDGETIIFDASVRYDGPSALLVDRQAFLSAMDALKLAPVWIVQSEKSAYGGPAFGQGFGGRVSTFGVYTAQADELTGNVRTEKHAPSRRQLEDLYK